jgi:pimeloyl-ACP methyl ester carboxylesterase
VNALFCLLHGAWHDPFCWEPLVGALRARGHDAVAPDLPFHDPQTTYADRIQPALEAVEGIRQPVVVVGHSLGALYAPFVAEAIPASRLILLCPGLPDLRPGFPFPRRRADGTSAWEERSAIAVMYRRLPAATAAALAARLRPMAPAADGSRPEPDRPATLIYTTDDEFFAPEDQREVARARPDTEAIEIPGGHFPMVEDEEALADVLVQVARKPPA